MFKVIKFSLVGPKSFNKISRNLAKCIPDKPTWDLIVQKQKQKISECDLKKLEKCSMLTIDEKIEKDLNDVINLVERMCDAKVSKETKSLIYFQYLGSCQLKEDGEKFFLNEENSSERLRGDILNNAKYTYEDYFVAPASKSN